MKEYILLAINIFFTVGLYMYAYDPKEEYVRVDAEVECLNLDLEVTLCAQCLTRSVFVDAYLGYVINSTTEYTGLKFPYKQSYITCKEAIHLIDYTDPSSLSVYFQRHHIMGELLSELDGKVILPKIGETTIEPEYESFIIFGWYNLDTTRGANILMPNDKVNKPVLNLFFKILNVIILTLIVTKLLITNDKQKSENSLVNFLVIILVLLLQLLTSSYAQDYYHLLLYFARTVNLILPVIRVEIRTTYIFIYAILGFLMAWNQLTLGAYAYLGWLLILIGGWDKLNVEPVWRYLMVSQLALSANYLVWYFSFQYKADTPLRIIEFSQLLMSLLALTLLSNRNVQKFKQYTPSDQRPIYLSGYDQEEEMVVRT